MKSFLEISFTAGSIDEARQISQNLVENKLVACAQIIPWIESRYIWNGELEATQESKVTLKAPEKNYPEIEKMIIEQSSYEVPEVIASKLEKVSASYMEWLNEACLHANH